MKVRQKGLASMLRIFLFDSEKPTQGGLGKIGKLPEMIDFAKMGKIISRCPRKF